VPKQFFLAKFESRYGADHGLDPANDYAAYVRGIVHAKTTSNEVFGFKLMSWYWTIFLIRLRGARVFGDAGTGDLDLLQNAFPRLRFVRVVRRHKLRQALSTARALQTGFGKCKREKPLCANRSSTPELIEQCLKEGERQEELWQSFFQRIGVDPFHVEYESLCEDYEATIRTVLDFLRIPLPRDARIGPAQRLDKPMKFHASGKNAFSRSARPRVPRASVARHV